MNIIAIDPGPEISALLVWDGAAVGLTRYGPNLDILGYVRKWSGSPATLVIEKVACFGMPVGAEVFETVFWSGRFAEAYGSERVHRITRIAVKNHICHSSRARDSNIRQALVDRFGGKDKAIGKKATPGPLFGISGDLWAALAVAVTWWDQNAVALDLVPVGALA